MLFRSSEESQLRVSMNLDRGKTVWVLGFVFFSPFFSVLYFFVDKRPVFFYKGLGFIFLFLAERARVCSIRLVFYFVDKRLIFFMRAHVSFCFPWVNGLAYETESFRCTVRIFKWHILYVSAF